MAKLTRKCKVCEKDFNIVENDYVHFRGGYTEVECFKKVKRAKGISDDVIETQLEELLIITKEEKRIRSEKDLELTRKKINSKKREKNRTENLNRLIKYFIEVYDVTVFPTFFYKKLADINRGTYKGVNTGIPYIDILDMFKRKQKYLNSIASKNSRTGKQIVGINRVNYDLAIIINKYDEYLNWKNKQKILESSINDGLSENKNIENINYSKFVTDNIRSENNEDVDIGDILEDIY